MYDIKDRFHQPFHEAISTQFFGPSFGNHYSHFFGPTFGNYYSHLFGFYSPIFNLMQKRPKPFPGGFDINDPTVFDMAFVLED